MNHMRFTNAFSRLDTTINYTHINQVQLLLISLNQYRFCDEVDALIHSNYFNFLLVYMHVAHTAASQMILKNIPKINTCGEVVRMQGAKANKGTNYDIF